MSKRVAVLGAGIMGSCLALALARSGHRVTLFEAAERPMNRASRWNEGKVHLGYMYAADTSLETAKKIFPGGLRFADDMSDLISADVHAAATRSEDTYLIHRDSVVDVEAAAAHYRSTDDLVAAHPDAARYLGGPRSLRSAQLDPKTLANITASPDIVAGFSIPERSVNTNRVADLTCLALDAAPIEIRCGVKVNGASPIAEVGGPWQVDTDECSETFDLVINALWEGKLGVDRTAGLPPTGEWSHRYRLALFVKTSRPVDAPSTIVAVGPFGDIKNYDGNSFYISWYPSGLVATNQEVAPEDPAADIATAQAGLVEAVRDGLGRFVPAVHEVLDAATEIRTEGGWVFAQAAGALSDPNSTIHKRDRYGIRRRGNYISIDTGKYSTAPSMALDLAAELS